MLTRNISKRICKLWSSSNFYELGVPITRNVETGLHTSKSFIFLKYDTCNCDMSHLIENEIRQQPIITTIRVNHVLQWRTVRHNKHLLRDISSKGVDLTLVSNVNYIQIV